MNTNPTTTTTTSGPRTRRSMLAATILGGILLAAGCGNAPRGEATQPSFGTDGAGTATSTVDQGPTTEAPGTDSSEQPLGDNGGNDGGGGGGWQPQGQGGDTDAGGEMEPFDDGDNGQPPAVGPCDEVLATGATLLVAPEPAVLPSGTMSSTLAVTNCGDEAVDWSAATIPNVALANAGGNLSAGSTSELAFTIDSSAYEPGAITFKIKVSEPGHNRYVDVHAFRELVGSDLVGDLGLTAGDEAGGCTTQCITSALLSASLHTPDVTLHVGTNTPAVLNVYVSEQAPGEQDGHPVFPGVGPVASSGSETTDFTTPVSPLSAGTKYHIIVEATDDNGNSAYRAGSFTTLTPVDLPDEIVNPGPPPGCAIQCITTALLSVTSHPNEMALTVDTHTSALIDVWVSHDEPQIVDGVPTFGDVEPAATTDGLDVEHWETVIPGLDIDSDYHVIVRASDLSGHRSYQVGTFHTAHAALITARFHSIHVVDDGDSDSAGELTFRWGTDGNAIGSEYVPVDSGVAFLIGHSPEQVTLEIESDGGFLPTLYVSGEEFDDAEIIEYCSPSLYTDWGKWDDCGIKWNSGSTGIITPAAFEGMPRCSEFELPAEYADAACTTLETPDVGNGYPVFWAVVSFETTAV